MASETTQPLIQHYDALVRAEAKGMLEPLVESVTREYLLVDRNQAADLMSMSRTFFEKYLFKTPQLKLIEHHVPGSKKVFYDPNELKRAVLSLMD